LATSEKYGSLFGCRTGITCVQGEIEGVFFSPLWVAKNRPNDVTWREGDAANAGLGQGAWVVTPLQMAVYACAITTGKLFKPTLLAGRAPELKRRLEWSPAVWRPVLQGLSDCVQTPRGTGRRLAIDGLSIYAKTGTAERGGGQEPHAWMFAVYPAEAPQFAIACILENGGHGGEVIAPLLRKFISATTK
jgi:peptidoglycan glycosyltransferase